MMKFHLVGQLTRRVGARDVNPYGQPDRKKTVFFLTTAKKTENVGILPKSDLVDLHAIWYTHTSNDGVC